MERVIIATWTDKRMKLYRIKNWKTAYENNRTRELKSLAWVPIPNDHDGDGYTTIMEHKDGAAIYGAWIAAVQVASRCDPRGTLVRGCNSPHNSDTLSRITRIPKQIFDRMFDVCSRQCHWLEVVEVTTIPQEGATSAAGECDNPAGECLEQKGMEGNGRERTEEKGNGRFAPPDISEVLLLASKSGLPENEAKKFHAYYDSKNWMVGKTKMKNWHSALSGWKLRWQERQPQQEAEAEAWSEEYMKSDVL